jgi:hypothetical protein
MLFRRDHPQERLKDKSEAVFSFGWTERGRGLMFANKVSYPWDRLSDYASIRAERGEDLSSPFSL